MASKKIDKAWFGLSSLEELSLVNNPLNIFGQTGGVYTSRCESSIRIIIVFKCSLLLLVTAPLLETVCLTKNRLTKVPKVVEFLPSLKRLRLSKNNITEVAEFIDGCRTLEEVRLVP